MLRWEIVYKPCVHYLTEARQDTTLMYESIASSVWQLPDPCFPCSSLSSFLEILSSRHPCCWLSIFFLFFILHCSWFCSYTHHSWESVCCSVSRPYQPWVSTHVYAYESVGLDSLSIRPVVTLTYP